jgi:hypothetical protein
VQGAQGSGKDFVAVAGGEAAIAGGHCGERRLLADRERRVGASVPGGLTADAMVTGRLYCAARAVGLPRALKDSPSAAHRNSSGPIPGASANAAGHGLA